MSGFLVYIFCLTFSTCSESLSMSSIEGGTKAVDVDGTAILLASIPLLLFSLVEVSDIFFTVFPIANAGIITRIKDVLMMYAFACLMLVFVFSYSSLIEVSLSYLLELH